MQRNRDTGMVTIEEVIGQAVNELEPCYLCDGTGKEEPDDPDIDQKCWGCGGTGLQLWAWY